MVHVLIKLRMRQTKLKQIISLICPTCDVTFSTLNPRQIYCSIACRRKSHNLKPEHAYYVTECKICGVDLAQGLTNVRRFCSRDCTYKYMHSKYVTIV